MATVTLKGATVNTIGALPAIGETAPDFELVDTALRDRTLGEFAGRKKLLYIVPSIDTSVCAATTRRFNELAAGKDAVLLMISADLPFAQKRFSEAGDLNNVTTLSTMRSQRFAEDYGVLITDGPLAGIMTRAVVVLDGSNRVIHTELVPEISQHPDYDAAIAALG
jgi:thioredoxin-dependent peroxiredoxin